MRVRTPALVAGTLAVVIVGSSFADGQHGAGALQMFNVGDAIGVTDPNVVKFNVLRSNVDPGHFESGSSEGEPTAVISTAIGKDGKRLVDDGTGKPNPALQRPNDGKAQIDENSKDAPLAKVQPHQRPFSAMNGDGKPGLAMAEFEGDYVKSVTLKDGSKIDFTGKQVTDAQITEFLDPKSGRTTLAGNNGVVKRAVDGSGQSVTCQG